MSVIDEVSVLVARVIDGREGTPALSDAGHMEAQALALEGFARRADDAPWLRYRVDDTRP